MKPLNRARITYWKIFPVVLLGLLSGDPASVLAAPADRVRIEQLLAAKDFAAAQREAENLAATVRRSGGNSDEYVDTLILLAKANRAAGNDSSALSTLQTAVAVADKLPNPRNATQAAMLQDIAALAERLNKLVLAQSYAIRELGIRETRLVKISTELFDPLSRVGRLYVLQGKFAEGLPYLLRALSLPDSSRVRTDRAPTLFYVGRAQVGLKHFDIAEQYFQRFADMNDPNDVRLHENEALARINLASAQNHLQKFSQASVNLERALALVPEKKPAVASNAQASKQLLAIYENLVVTREGLGRKDDALKAAVQALALVEAMSPVDELWVADRIQIVAALQRANQNPREAVKFYSRASEIYKRKLGEADPRTQATLNGLHDAYADLGQYAEAKELSHKTIDPDSPISLSNLSVALKGEGRYAEAEALVRRALDIQRRADPNDASVARMLNNLATVVENFPDRVPEAQALYEESLALKEKQLGPDHQDVAYSLDNLADIYRRQRNFVAAEKASQRSLRIFEKTLGPRHPEYLTTLFNLGRIAFDQAQFDRAEEYITKAGKNAEEAFGPRNDLAVRAAISLSEIKIAKRKVAYLAGSEERDGPLSQEALQGSRRAIAMAVAWNEARPPDARVNVWLEAGIRQAVSEHVAELHGLAEADPSQDLNLGSEAFEAAQWADMSQAGRAIQQSNARFVAADKELAARIRERQDLVSERSRIERRQIELLAARSSPVELAKFRESMAATEKQMSELDKRIAVQFPHYSDLVAQRSLAVRDLQKLLTQDEALVFYLLGAEGSYIFAVTSTEFSWKPIPYQKDSIVERVGRFRKGLDLAKRDLLPDDQKWFDLELAYETYGVLLGPVDGTIASKRHLIVVPSGPLTALPFHLLVTDPPPSAVASQRPPALFQAYKDASWLIKRQGVSVLPSVDSLRSLRSTRAGIRATKPMIGFGDPVFSASRPAQVASAGITINRTAQTAVRAYSEYWVGAEADRATLSTALARLPETADELLTVAKYLKAPPSAIFLREKASETEVKAQSLQDYQVVYFATHGLIAGDIKGVAEPSLALSLPAQSSALDDGLLTASEVAQLRLNADWVVLSACNTIAGDRPGAEALSGLAKSFFYAGAKSLLVSHWAVDSVAATVLTTASFRSLSENPRIGKAEALRRAMLNFTNGRTDASHADPAYWGPFAVVGEAGNTDSNQ